MLPPMTIICILPTIPIFILSLLIIGCSSKKAETEVGGQAKGIGSAGHGQPTPAPTSTPAPVSPAKPAVPVEKSTPEKKTNSAGAAVGGDEKGEENGGYESCPDMTPEQLAKIANESPAK